MWSYVQVGAVLYLPHMCVCEKGYEIHSGFAAFAIA